MLKLLVILSFDYSQYVSQIHFAYIVSLNLITHSIFWYLVKPIC